MHQTGRCSIPFRHDNIVDEAAVDQFQDPYDDSYEGSVDAGPFIETPTEPSRILCIISRIADFYIPWGWNRARILLPSAES